MKSILTWRRAVVSALAVVTVACGTTFTGPDFVTFEVIGETPFAASLDIDLSTFTRLESGVYIQDVAEGSGAVLSQGTSGTVAYTGWLADGTEFDSGTFSFTVGSLEVIPGFEQGVLGTKAGGIRRIIIPPELAYGARGSGPVPGGAIVIFRVELVEVI
ncbi:MAG TPA: FKBP-type peptidyl-prolyl cis-trans isomerase [Longimicrobiales bacterium]|nr:FKBP-type peptidyl-prolyl cis-trans isomerase [Longimicrobiales bacterium]